jgi:sulfate adenylyltransferase subunit 1 (EFTu-like GTPase family)
VEIMPAMISWLFDLATAATTATTALVVIAATTGILSEDCFHAFFLLSVGFIREKWNA